MRISLRNARGNRCGNNTKTFVNWFAEQFANQFPWTVLCAAGNLIGNMCKTRIFSRLQTLKHCKGKKNLLGIVIKSAFEHNLAGCENVCWITFFFILHMHHGLLHACGFIPTKFFLRRPWGGGAHGYWSESIVCLPISGLAQRSHKLAIVCLSQCG